MISLNAALDLAGAALSADSQAIGITGQNLANQTTPGYAAQIVEPQSDAFDISQGLAGGVSVDSVDSRSQFAEQAVWYQQGQTGQYQSFTENASAVAQVLDLNDPTGSTGILGSLTQLLQSFSTLLASPNSSGPQNGVIEAAQAFAANISSAAETVQQTVTNAHSAADDVVSQINQLVGQVQEYNQQLQSGVPPSATAEAQVYASLETLSNLAPISTQQNSNGTISILMNGTTPLLTGTQQFKLQADLVGPAPGAAYPQGNPTLRILDGQGQDITSSITGGQLGGLINYVNNFAPTLIGNGSQQGALNQLAQGLADSVNATLGGSTPLFQYGSGDPTSIAQSLQVNSSYTSTDLSKAMAANPNATESLSNIASGATLADQINGQSFSAFLSTTESNAASAINTQQSGLTMSTQLLEQAQANRTQVQGVSLETESVNLIQYQEAFQAATEVISVINTMLQDAENMITATT
jgi:flagellar hook-associated protein 1 FlgK